MRKIAEALGIPAREGVSRFANFRQQRRLSRRALTALLDTLAVQTEAGVNDAQVLQSFFARARKRGLYKRDHVQLQKVLSKVRSGSTLSEALRPHLGYAQFLILSAGESSGKIHEAVALILGLEQERQAVQEVFRSSMQAPVIYLLTLLVTLIIVSKQVVPSLEQIVSPAQWHGMAQMVYLSTKILDPLWGIALVVFVLATILAYRWALPNLLGRTRLFAEKYLPGFGLYRDMQGVLWIGSFASMLQSGMVDTHILQLQMQHASPWLRERLRKIQMLMTEGYSFDQALLYAGPGRLDRALPDKGVKYEFPSPRINDDIANYVGFQGFSEKLLKLRDVWLKRQIKVLRSNLGWVGVAIQFVVFGYLIALTIGVNQLSSQIGSAVGN
ncbi:MAG: type II secretion system F family protein [Acidithiobacillus sp.]